MSHGTPHDLADGHVLLDTDTYENALDMLLSPGDDLGLSPFPDIGDDLLLQADANLLVTQEDGSSGDGKDSSGVFDGRGSGELIVGTGSGSDAVPGGRKRRINANQAKVQKRYRERKKKNLADLERTVNELRAQVQEMQKSQSKSRSSTESDEENDTGQKLKSATPGSSPGASPPDSGTTAVALLDPHKHYYVNDPDAGDSLLTDIIAATKREDSRGEKRVHKNFWFALEVADVVKRGSSTSSTNAPSATGKFKSFADAELYFSGVVKLYDVGVEKLKGLLAVGASDARVQSAVMDIVRVVSDARQGRPGVSFFTTQLATIAMLDDDCEPGPDGVYNAVSKTCPTSCAYLVKSVVDRTLMKGDWEEITDAVIEMLPPNEITKIIEWSDEFLTARKDVMFKRATVLFPRPEPETRPVEGLGEVAVNTLYRVPKEELTGIGNADDGGMTETQRIIFEGLQEEMRLHHVGTQKLFETLSPRSAAKIIILMHPVALDTISLAIGLKKKRGIDPKNTSWKWLKEAFAVNGM